MTITWKLIDDTGAALGAKEEARRKWRQRGLPPVWQIKIAQHLMKRGIPVALGDFAKLPIKPGRIDA